MKSIAKMSILSFLVIVALYAAYLARLIRSSGDNTKIDAKPSVLSKDDTEAIAMELRSLDRKRNEVLEMEGKLKALWLDLEMGRKGLLREQEKLGRLIEKFASERRAVADNQDRALSKLAKMYEMMKPKEAAEIASNLSIDILVSIIPRMKERAAAKLISELETGKAVQISQRLSGLKGVDR